MTYTVTLTTKTEIEVAPAQNDIDAYGLVQAIIEAARNTDAYKAEREEFDASIRSIEIDGEEVTQF